MGNYTDTAGREWQIEYDPPPIPLRGFDWRGYRDGCEEEGTAFGGTRDELLDQIEEDAADVLYEEAQ